MVFLVIIFTNIVNILFIYIYIYLFFFNSSTNGTLSQCMFRYFTDSLFFEIFFAIVSLLKIFKTFNI